MLHRQTHTQIGAQRQGGQQLRHPNALACRTHAANLPLLVRLAVVGRCRGNGCPAQLRRSCPAGWAGFGSPCPWPVAVPGARLSVIGCGLVGSSHDAILWSRACHTFPSPRLMTLGASSDHGGGCLVSGDVFIWDAQVMASPRAAVGGRRSPDAPCRVNCLLLTTPSTKPNLRPVMADKSPR